MPIAIWAAVAQPAEAYSGCFDTLRVDFDLVGVTDGTAIQAPEALRVHVYASDGRFDDEDATFKLCVSYDPAGPTSPDTPTASSTADTGALPQTIVACQTHPTADWTRP